MSRRLHRSTALTLLLLLWSVLLGPTTADARPWIRGIQSPQHFAISVQDVDRSVAWYRQALGLRILDDTRADDGRWRIVNLKSDRLLVEVIHDRRAEAVGRHHGFFKVGFAVRNVERVADRVERATGERPRIVDMEKHGQRILQLVDPDGNKLQLFSPLRRR